MMYHGSAHAEQENYLRLKDGFEKLDEISREFLNEYVDLVAEHFVAQSKGENNGKQKMVDGNTGNGAGIRNDACWVFQ
ncbi:MAG: hypothetical protein LBB82_01835 [Treponema sp.]|jgi:hypothetical protein|nr:hypothetical protein [Treponema sp.]